MNLRDYIDENGKCVIPEGVTEIEDDAFHGCTNLKDVTIPKSVRVIGKWAFLGCTGLTSLSIPSGVSIIRRWAFMGCTGLTSIKIPRVRLIGDWAFSECTGLVSVEIPDSVAEIGHGAFDGCTGLASVIIRTSEQQPENASNALYILQRFDPSVVTLRVPSGCGDVYRLHPDFNGKLIQEDNPLNGPNENMEYPYVDTSVEDFIRKCHLVVRDKNQ